jgi:hypothetical protein
VNDLLLTFSRTVLTAVLPTLALVVAGYLILLLHKLALRLGIDVANRQEARLEQIVGNQIHATEEASHRDPLRSEEKLTRTVDATLVAATMDPTVPTPTKEKVELLVDAELGKLRAAGALTREPPAPGLP